jgi:hypothetical protein
MDTDPGWGIDMIIINIVLDGPVTRDDWLVFAAHGSSSNDQAANAYSSTVLNGSEREEQLAAPMLP